MAGSLFAIHYDSRSSTEQSLAAGFMATGVEQGRAMLGQGFRILAYGGDVWPYQRALREGLAALRPSGGG